MPKQPTGMSRYEITFPTEEEIRQERERWLQGAKAFIFSMLGIECQGHVWRPQKCK